MSGFTRRAVQHPAEWHRLYCSFCGRSDRRVRFLVAGKSGGMICNTCCLTAVFTFAQGGPMLKSQLLAALKAEIHRHDFRAPAVSGPMEKENRPLFSVYDRRGRVSSRLHYLFRKEQTSLTAFPRKCVAILKTVLPSSSNRVNLYRRILFP